MIYICNNCDYETTRSDNFKRHLNLMKHKQAKYGKKTKVNINFNCDTCNKSFTRLTSLQRHTLNKVCCKVESAEVVSNKNINKIINKKVNELVNEKVKEIRSEIESELKQYNNDLKQQNDNIKKVLTELATLY